MNFTNGVVLYLYRIIKDIRRVSNLEVGQARAPPQAHSNLIPRVLSLLPFSKRKRKDLETKLGILMLAAILNYANFQQRFLDNLTASNRFSTTQRT